MEFVENSGLHMEHNLSITGKILEHALKRHNRHKPSLTINGSGQKTRRKNKHYIAMNKIGYSSAM